jgi:peptidylprolyl isomerase
MHKTIVLILSVALVGAGCSEEATTEGNTNASETNTSQTQQEVTIESTKEETMEKDLYVPAEDTTGFVETDSGLKYKNYSEGEGPEATSGDLVSVHYTGTLADGTKFDSSVDRGQPFQFNLGAGMVIKGWDEGVAGMKIGGTRVLVIPAELGYGDRGAGGAIPPGAELHFQVELIKISGVDVE